MRHNFPRNYKGTRKYPKVAGVYVILGPRGVYVGQSVDCWRRQTLRLAALLGLDCGIIREVSRESQRLKAERDIGQLFKDRGFPVLSLPERSLIMWDDNGDILYV